MVKTEVAKVLVFNEDMNCILLQREDALAPISCRLTQGTLFNELQKHMLELLAIPVTSQPYWWLMRTEVFQSAQTYVHVFFGKISMDEMLRIEISNKQFVVIDTKSAISGQKIVAHRLKYLIPMAMVLSQVEAKYWPAP